MQQLVCEGKGLELKPDGRWFAGEAGKGANEGVSLKRC